MPERWGNCQGVIDKWKNIIDELSAQTNEKLKDNPLEAQLIDKEIRAALACRIVLAGLVISPAWM